MYTHMTENETAAARAPPEVKAVETDCPLELLQFTVEHPALKAALDTLVTQVKTFNETTRFAKATLFEVRGMIADLGEHTEALDSIDLEYLKPEWGDKQVVRMTRKNILKWIEALSAGLDEILSYLKENQQPERAVDAVEETLEEKYKETLERTVPEESAVNAASDDEEDESSTDERQAETSANVNPALLAMFESTYGENAAKKQKVEKSEITIDMVREKLQRFREQTRAPEFKWEMPRTCARKLEGLLDEVLRKGYEEEMLKKCIEASLEAMYCVVECVPKMLRGQATVLQSLQNQCCALEKLQMGDSLDGILHEILGLCKTM